MTTFSEWTQDRLSELLRLAKSGRLTNETQSEIFKLHQDVIKGEVPRDCLYTTIHIFGEAGYKDAKSLVLSFLSDSDPQLRKVAAHVLAHHWKLDDCEEELVHLLQTDPNDEVRAEAATGLSNLRVSSEHDQTVEAIHRVLVDDDEPFLVRKNAYKALLRIRGGYDPTQVFRLTRRASDIDDLDLSLVE